MRAAALTFLGRQLLVKRRVVQRRVLAFDRLVDGFAPEEVLRRAVDFYGADKVMWGSDIGTSSGSYAEMITRGKESTKLLSEDERRALKRRNARARARLA